MPIAVLLLLHVVGVLAFAQSGRWDFRQITHSESDKYNPQVAVDRWGTSHLLYGSRDPRRSGLQLFYVTDATGQFSAPIQVTDTGTVFDSTNSSISSFAFKLDSLGNIHVAFVANVENHLRLYYTSNISGRFAPAKFLAEQTRYDLAVDSIGHAHIVWIESDEGVNNLHYWNSAIKLDMLLASRACNNYNQGCLIGDPEVEVSRRGVDIALRSDSSSIYYTRYSFGEGIGPLLRLVAPGYDKNLTRLGLADLRLRMATDPSGAVHILAPHYLESSRHRMLYLNNTNGTFSSRFLTADTLEKQISEFDITVTGQGRLSTIWTFGSIGDSINPRTAYAELAEAASRIWNITSFVPDINPLLSSGRAIWKSGSHVSIYGSRVAIVGLVRPDTLRTQVGLITRSAIRPVLSYLLPDAAAPGMNVVVESFAPYREQGSFGADGFHGDTVTLQLRNPSDSARVVIGPSVVSWQGRLLSTMIFVKPGAAPGPVPVAVRVGSGTTNTDTFFVVTPQHLGDASGQLSGGGSLGSGGQFGLRSKRGVLVVDSLILTSGTFTVDTSDTDPALDGNQGFLPVTILSAGPVRIDSGAVLSVAAHHDGGQGVYGTAGPGGGGGGSGGWIAGGSGYSGGGGAGWLEDGGPLGISGGTGGIKSGRWGGGLSIAGTPGGVAFPSGSSGGGTGHPFGSSGSFGRTSADEPSILDMGGSGGGSGGSKLIVSTAMAAGGGGGSHATPGGTGNHRIEVSNGGGIVGSVQLVPLAGGSGGGGGGFSGLGVASGGGGGGALALIGYKTIAIDGTINADGAPGVSQRSSSDAGGGGGGAGGGIYIGARESVTLSGNASLSANGGAGGSGSVEGGRSGGNGGDGRIRIDGRRVRSTKSRLLPAPMYMGPATGSGSMLVARQGMTVRGFGKPGSVVRVFTRPEGGRWSFQKPVSANVGADSVWTVTLGSDAGNGVVYVAAMQRVDDPSNVEFASEPSWVMSPAGGNVVGRPAVKVSPGSYDFNCIRFDTCGTSTVWVRNTGQYSDLIIRSVSSGMPGMLAFSASLKDSVVAPGDSVAMMVTFCPGDTGSFEGSFVVRTNAFPDSVRQIDLEGCAATGRLAIDEPEVDLGAICQGDCRDTTFHLFNSGSASLSIYDVRTVSQKISALVRDSLPLTIAPGAAADIRLRICAVDLSTAGDTLVFFSNTVEPFYSLAVRAVDNLPMPSVPAAISFGTVDLTTPDRCVERTMTVRNLSTSNLLDLRFIDLPSAQFELLDPFMGSIIPPGDSIVLRVRFCAAAAGPVSANAKLTFGTGYCSTEQLVMLQANATGGSPDVRIVRPADPRITFDPILVHERTPDSLIVLSNLGTAPARIVAPQVTVDGVTTRASEVELLDRGITYPHDIAPGDSVVYRVRLIPATLGIKEATVLFQTETDSIGMVTINGQGTQPGLQVRQPIIDFGDVRLDSAATRTLEVWNDGTAPDRVTELAQTPEGKVSFQLDSTNLQIPALLRQDKLDTLRAYYRFTPVAEGQMVDTVTVVSEGGALQTAVLIGRGIREHIVANRSVIDFGAIADGTYRDSIGAVTFTNSGTAPLTIDRLRITQSESWFSLLNDRTPVVLLPDSSMTIDIRYAATRVDASAVLTVFSSAEQPIDVTLIGSTLAEKPMPVTLAVDDQSGNVGDVVLIPLSFVMGEPLTEPVDYTLDVTFDKRMLAPRIGPGSDARQPAIAGSFSESATWTRVSVDVVRITGRLMQDAKAG